MTRKLLALGLFAHVAATVWSVPSVAAERNTGQVGNRAVLNPAKSPMKSAIAGGVRGAPAIQVAPLTTNECVALGGRVVSFAACNSGQVCNRVDENNVGHAVCISAK